MVLMGLIGWGAAALFWKTLSDVSTQKAKNACPTLDDREFDLKNMARGINPNEVYKIAARCRVPLKDGILPYYKYKDCLSYVEKHANTPSDVDLFIKQWKKVARQTEQAKAKKIQRENEPNYQQIVNMFKKDIINTNTIILTYNDNWNLTEAEHNERVDNLYRNTYLGERAVRPPKVRFDPEIYGKRIEVWEVRARDEDIQDERQTMARWNRLYNTCCKKCGYPK